MPGGDTEGGDPRAKELITVVQTGTGGEADGCFLPIA